MKTPIRLLLALLAAAVVVLFVLYHQTGRKESRAMEAAVQTGLQRFYGRLANDQSRGTNAAAFTSDELTRAVHDELAHSRFFPGFVKPSDVSVSTVSVGRGTTNLLCVIEPWQATRYGIDGAGGCRKISDAEYQSWPHSGIGGSPGQ